MYGTNYLFRPLPVNSHRHKGKSHYISLKTKVRLIEREQKESSLVPDVFQVSRHPLHLHLPSPPAVHLPSAGGFGRHGEMLKSEYTSSHPSQNECILQDETSGWARAA